MRAPELLAAALLGLAAPAWAALGEPLASVQADRQRLQASHRMQAAADHAVHSLRAADGSLVREYVGADGVVFAVTWSTRSKPRLEQLLGRHFETYAGAARAAMQRRAGVMHSAALQQGDLQVQSSGHLQNFSGRAWLRSRLPAGMGPDALR